MTIFNQGVDYECCETQWFSQSAPSMNYPAICQSVANLGRRSKDNNSQMILLLRAITCLDLTTLSGDDACSNVRRLCYKAENPLDEELCMALTIPPNEISCGAVCVYPTKVSTCVETLKSLSSEVPVAAVAAGFPSGQYHLKSRLTEIESCVKDGAKEIDIVISRDLVLRGQWKKLYDEVSCMRSAAGRSKLKAIIAAGQLGSLTNVFKASLICMAAGADFIKTSTGKESVNATLVIGTVMVRAIRTYFYVTGYKVGFKPAGGIRTAQDVLLWQELMLKELGDRWLYPDLFRIGASSLLGDIEQYLFRLANQNVTKPLPFL